MAEGRRVSHVQPAKAPGTKKKRVGITMFGVTTPCVDLARKHLEGRYGYEVFVFHATGHGGIAMERLVKESRLDAIFDLTTSEICDHIVGGNMSAGPESMNVPLSTGISYLVSLGALDMMNFGPKELVPQMYQNRKLHEHNPIVTLMRTNDEEYKQIAEFIVNKLQTYTLDPAKVKVIIPTGGISMLSTPGGPFADAEADNGLFSTMIARLADSPIEALSHPDAVNDEHFAVDAAELLARIINEHEGQ